VVSLVVIFSTGGVFIDSSVAGETIRQKHAHQIGIRAPDWNQ